MGLDLSEVAVQVAYKQVVEKLRRLMKVEEG